MKHLIVSGCSFSTGSSLISNAIENPHTWSHFLVKKYNPKIYANLALSGGGNLSATYNLIYFLEKNKWINTSSMVVIFNITGLERIDLICPNEHPNGNKNNNWANDFKFNWITEGSFTAKTPPFNGMLQKNVGWEQSIILNSLSLISCIQYLESRKINYFFMIMDNTISTDAPEFFTNFLKEKESRFIQFDKFQNMHDFVKDKNLLSEDNFHPSNKGHELMSKYIIDFIENTSS